MMWWKVKKLMPRGSTQSRRPSEKPAKCSQTAGEEVSVFEQRPSTARFSTIAAVMMALLRVAANFRAANQFIRIETTSNVTNAGFQ
jgi:hypothetical protein